MAERIQQKRTKGWRKPEGAVSVARPSKWGNPYVVGESLELHVGAGHPNATRIQRIESITPRIAVELYRALWMTNWNVADTRSWPRPIPSVDLEELRGKNLMCWCPLDQPCHADVLLELANKEATDV